MIDKKSFICGFVTGEGCFTFIIQNNSLSPIFSITTNINDISLLKMIKDELDVGNVSILKKNFSCALQVYNIKDCFKLIEYFDNNLNGKKKEDFLIWKKGLLKLQEIRKQKPYHSKYTLKQIEYFKSLRPRNRNN